MAAMRRDILGIAGAVAVATLIATPRPKPGNPGSDLPDVGSGRHELFASAPTQ